MTGSASALSGYCELSVSEGRMVEIKCYSVFSKVELPSMLIICRLSGTLPGRQISGYLLISGSRKPY